MNQEQVTKYAEDLYYLDAELIMANDGYNHDPEAHNLCSVICEF